jgi:ornithine cyclodeaminase
VTLRLLDEVTIRALVGPREALAACREAFRALARGEVVQPEPMGFDLKDRHGEAHVKGAYLRGAPFFSIKVATGFYGNLARGLPVGSGVVWVFDAETGFPAAILLDNGYLTELRTGAAGAVAAEALAPQVVRRVAIVGAGVQARYQLEALLLVRTPVEVVVASRDPAHAAAYAAQMQATHGIPVRAAASVQEAVTGADLVVTTTPARAPIVMDAWIGPGTHITAMGSDLPEKQELEAELLARATVFADSRAQCLTQGEAHHAVAAGVLDPARVIELGAVVLGRAAGRTRPDEITVADLTGLGALDAAVANAVMARTAAEDAGRQVDLV